MYNNPLTDDFITKLRKLRDFASLVEDTFVARVAALDATLKEQGERFPETERFEIFEYYLEDYYELGEELPTILRYSVLTAADTAFEVYLNVTCQTFSELRKLEIRVNDLQGRGTERARRFLKKVAKMPFPDQHPSWTTVARLHDLRNSIIHTDGVVEAPRPHLHQWASSFAGLDITSRGHINLERDFTTAALNAYLQFAEPFDAACEALGLWDSVFPPLDG